jgi:HK97 family phage portal protein
LPDEVLHLRDRSDTGLIGRSRLSRAAETVVAALSVQSFASNMIRNGANPSGAFEMDGVLGDAGRVRLTESFKQSFAGPQNAARALILDHGIKWRQISVSPEDAELLASRRFSTEELARIFQVPPPLVGIWDHSSFTNSETAGRWFAQHTLSPWIRKLEAEFSRSVFTAGSSSCLELDLGGFLRGDPAQRWAGYDIAIKNRVLTPNEVREAEGYNPRTGGDEFPTLAPAGTGG